jgi:hypothetical protein
VIEGGGRWSKRRGSAGSADPRAVRAARCHSRQDLGRQNWRTRPTRHVMDEQAPAVSHQHSSDQGAKSGEGGHEVITGCPVTTAPRSIACSPATRPAAPLSSKSHQAHMQRGPRRERQPRMPPPGTAHSKPSRRAVIQDRVIGTTFRRNLTGKSSRSCASRLRPVANVNCGRGAREEHSRPAFPSPDSAFSRPADPRNSPAGKGLAPQRKRPTNLGRHCSRLWAGISRLL